jgi:hypothetical protein
MKRLVALFGVCFGILCPTYAPAQSIVINDFNPWVSMGGSVSGLNSADLQKLFVVVYVHSQYDEWYIHPYRYIGPKAGLSWAKVDQDGKWQIALKDRDEGPMADCVAALVVAHPVAATDFKIHDVNRISQRPIAQARKGVADGHPTGDNCVNRSDNQ